jgi:hypothetical protein
MSHKTSAPFFELSTRTVIAFFFAFLAVACFAFYTNRACLFFNFDGASWAVVMDYFEQFSSPFSIAMVDPLQGMFDIYHQGYRGALPQNVLVQLIGMPGLNKVFTHVFYTIVVALSIYAMGQSADFGRDVSLLAPFLFAALTLPMFNDDSVLDSISSLNPNYIYLIGVTTLVIVLFWRIDACSWFRAAALTTAILTLLFSVAWALIYYFVYITVIAAVLGVAALFAENSRSTLVAKLSAGACIAALILAAGFVNYLYDLASNTAMAVFAHELDRPRELNPRPLGQALSEGIPFLFTNFEFTWMMTAGAAGAVLVALFTTSRRSRAFALGYLGLVILYALTSFIEMEYWPSLTGGRPYTGPAIYRFVHFISALASVLVAAFLLFVLRATFASAQKAMSPLMHCPPQHAVTSTKSNPADSTDAASGGSKRYMACGNIFTTSRFDVALYSMLIAALATPAGLALTNNPGPTQKYCTRPYFSPLERNVIIDYLEPRIGLDLGKPFNGSVVTFTGTERHDARAWMDSITTDWHLWYNTGNDLRTIGLWQYRIPTLMQASISITPQFYLTVLEFLTQPQDKQIRGLLSFTKPDEKMMSLWGVRYVITDKSMPFGAERVEMSVKPSAYYASPIRLYELAQPNLGNYSPIQVVKADDAVQTLALMKNRNFDGKQTVVTDAGIAGSFLPAREVSMTLISGGLSLRAASDGDSLLVLPVQYSHCWVTTDPKVSFFRANMMQLGVRFSGPLSSDIKLEFGPFWHSYCRRQDAHDAERLNMAVARRARLQ